MSGRITALVVEFDKGEKIIFPPEFNGEKNSIVVCDEKTLQQLAEEDKVLKIETYPNSLYVTKKVEQAIKQGKWEIPMVKPEQEKGEK